MLLLKYANGLSDSRIQLAEQGEYHQPVFYSPSDYNRQESEILRNTLTIKITPEQWSGREDQWVKTTHPYAFEINDKIKEKKAIVSDLIKRHYLANKDLSFEVIDRHLKKKGDPLSFIEYMKDYIRNPPEKLELGTIKKYNTCLKHLQAFRPAISFGDIDENLMQGFFQYLHKTLGLEGASIKKYFSALKKVIKTARRDSHIDASSIEFLYADVKITVKPSMRRVFPGTG